MSQDETLKNNQSSKEYFLESLRRQGIYPSSVENEFADRLSQDAPEGTLEAIANNFYFLSKVNFDMGINKMEMQVRDRVNSSPYGVLISGSQAHIGSGPWVYSKLRGIGARVQSFTLNTSKGIKRYPHMPLIYPDDVALSGSQAEGVISACPVEYRQNINPYLLVCSTEAKEKMKEYGVKLSVIIREIKPVEDILNKEQYNYFANLMLATTRMSRREVDGSLKGTFLYFSYYQIPDFVSPIINGGIRSIPKITPYNILHKPYYSNH